MSKLQNQHPLRVLLVHPGTQHAPRLAATLERRGLLWRFWTGFAKANGRREADYRTTGRKDNGTKGQPEVGDRRSETGDRLHGNQLIKDEGTKGQKAYGIRHTARGKRRVDIPGEKLRTIPWVEVMALLLARLPVNKEKLWHWRNGLFQKLVPRREIEAADVVVGFDTSAWIVGQRAKKAGKKFVLDQSVGHPLSRAKAVREAGGDEEMWPQAFGDRLEMVSNAEALEHELADVVVAASSFSKKTLVENGVPEGKIRVISYGVGSEFVAAGAAKIRGLQDNGTKGLQGGARSAHFDRDNFDNLKDDKLATKPFRFLYAGYLTKRKGIDVLLRAGGALQNVEHGARSMELGVGKEKKSEARGKGLEADPVEYASHSTGQEDLRLTDLKLKTTTVAELRLVGGGERPEPLPAGVVCLGQTPREALLGEMSEADVFVFPSLFEGFALVILEAMAAGLPVITTPNTAGPDLIEDGKEGLIVPAGDANALRVAMESLLNDPERARSMGRAAHEKAKEYTWERYGERWEEMLHELCS